MRFGLKLRAINNFVIAGNLEDNQLGKGSVRNNAAFA
jgi:hypothetical protein